MSGFGFTSTFPSSTPLSLGLIMLNRNIDYLFSIEISVAKWKNKESVTLN